MNKINSLANTEELIDMISEDRYTEAKQHLGSVLPLVEAAALPGGGRQIECGNCRAYEHSTTDERFIEFQIDEPDWSNCAGCELK